MSRIDLGPNPGPDGRPPVPVEVTQIQTTLELEKSPQWMGPWVAGDYVDRDMVRDEGWLMYANKDTADRPSPQPQGDPFWFYTGTIGSAQATAKQVIFGNRYEVGADGFINGWRIDTVIGNEYRVFIVDDPTGTPVIRSLIDFTAATNGWTTFNIPASIILTGEVFDLVAIVNEPDPSPTTITGFWDYIKPNNPTIPLAGQATQSSKSLDIISFNYTDDDGNDRKTDLDGLQVGDIINVGSQSWAIQQSTPGTTFIDFAVSPASQAAVSGRQEFTFETVTATPITYGVDTDYWLTIPNVSGLLGIDTDYSSIIPDNNAYGMDLLVQNALVSDDWDVLVAGSAAGDSGSSSVEGNNVPPDDFERRDHGWAQYGDSTWTESNKFVVDNERRKITLDGLARTITGYLPTDTNGLWDTVNNKITPNNVGDRYDLRLSWKAIDGVQIEQYDVQLDIGGSSGIILEQTRRVDKGNSATTRDWISAPIYSLQTFVDNGGEIWIDTTFTGGKVEFWDFVLVIGRSYRSS